MLPSLDIKSVYNTCKFDLHIIQMCFKGNTSLLKGLPSPDIKSVYTTSKFNLHVIQMCFKDKARTDFYKPFKSHVYYIYKYFNHVLQTTLAKCVCISKYYL